MPLPSSPVPSAPLSHLTLCGWPAVFHTLTRSSPRAKATPIVCFSSSKAELVELQPVMPFLNEWGHLAVRPLTQNCTHFVAQHRGCSAQHSISTQYTFDEWVNESIHCLTGLLTWSTLRNCQGSVLSPPEHLVWGHSRQSMNILFGKS